MKTSMHAPTVRKARRARWLACVAAGLGVSAAGAFPAGPEAAAGTAGFGPGDGGAAPILLAQAADEVINKPVTRQVSYSKDQADRGEKLFSRACQECHGDDLKGGLNGGAPLRGSAFEEKYAEGAPASILYVYVSNQMPPNSPGRYSANDYADLVAYILKRNGFQPGDPLPGDVDKLYDLTIGQ